MSRIWIVTVVLLLSAVAQVSAQNADVDNARLHYRVGTKALEDNDLATARDEFQKAARLTPGNALIWYNLAIVQSKLGEATGARDSLKRADDLGLPKELKAGADELLASILYEERRSSRERQEVFASLKRLLLQNSPDPGWSTYELEVSGCGATLVTTEIQRWYPEAPPRMRRTTILYRVDDTFQLRDLDRDATTPRQFTIEGDRFWNVTLRGVEGKKAIMGRMSEYNNGQRMFVTSNQEFGGRKFPTLSSDELSSTGHFNVTSFAFKEYEPARLASDLFRRAISLCATP
jgi:hypothetical protein